MKIFLAGGENNQHAQSLFETKAPYVLLSYYYLRAKKEADTIKFLEQYKKTAKDLLLDSGAHTFFSAYGIGKLFGGKDTPDQKAKVKSDFKETPDRYVKKYKEWLKMFGKYFEGVVELDIDRVPGVGVEKIKQWRKEFVAEGITNLIPVWHDSMGKIEEDFDQLCKEFKFVAVEGQKPPGHYVSCFAIAKKYKTKIHAFAGTNESNFRRFPFYSTDSTTWLTGVQYGMSYFFKAGKMVQFGKNSKDQRKRFKTMLESRGVNWEGLTKDNFNEVNKMNIIAWVDYGEHIHKRQEKYWESGKDKNAKDPSLEPQDPTLVPEEGDTEIKDITIEKVEEDYDQKNRISLRQAARANTWAWKHGKFSRYKPVPPVVYKILEYIDDHDLNEEQAKGHIATLIKDNLKRIEINKVWEMLDGGVQDPKLSALIKDTVYILFMFQGKMMLPTGDFTQNLTQVNIGGEVAKELGQLKPKQRDQVIDSLRRIINKGDKKGH